MALFFGKFSDSYPEQIEEKFYVGGDKGSERYGGLDVGDYVYPIYKGTITRLWRVKAFTQKQNRINKENPNIVEFEEIKIFDTVRLAHEFVRYKHFELDLKLLNKSSKSIKNCGFFKISTSEKCPPPEEIIFQNNLRTLYITFDIETGIQYKEGDIRILIESDSNTKIKDIQFFDGNTFSTYTVLWDLYLEKNPENQRYTLNELLSYAKKDKASKKENHLSAIQYELADSGYCVLPSPIALYDNILVGRKKTPSSSSKASTTPVHDLSEFFDDEDDTEITEYDKYAQLLEFNPNLILYGPPGTGKTYAAIKIVESFETRRNNGLLTSFESVKKEGRVKFVTFHQSYSYEEFIEGIRPEMDESSDDGDGASKDVRYKIEPGVLMQLANDASMQSVKFNIKDDVMSKVNESSRIWKVSLGYRKEEDVYHPCKKDNVIAVGWLGEENLDGKSYDDIYSMLVKERGDNGKKPIKDANSIDTLVNRMKEGDIVLIYDGLTTIRDIGVINDDQYIYCNDDNNPYPHRRHVKWIKEFEKPVDIFELNGKTRLTLQTIYELWRINFSDIKELIKEEEESTITETDNGVMPYYLIVDEINRGNIAKIFGELITLIEKDKRENISCTLPYSKKPFKLPANIFIIGTMNTADRSIAVLDTALRRRFLFAEIEPNIEVFDNPVIVKQPVVNDKVDLKLLLEKLNNIILEKLDRDHRIGHAYFFNIDGLRDLYTVWYYKVLPLVMEYFYNDKTLVQETVGKVFLNSDGTVNYLSTRKEEEDQISPFERALINIYNGK